ncbi:HdeD family acid-resistance protein [Mycobacterium sp. SMC-4]|uniref:HdeD family acid-resistance protein n=1 Tax=Mycobacterium sp. SMC-4 TaxID=2857059 RepID=UPI0021B44DD8|nr:HdeD family acid-resistance protein [Mycobacterium sp. SMC-4]UXA20350.1 HdeD family acid-resistance protein [Mycobacterium sp. SMC-4]
METTATPTLLQHLWKNVLFSGVLTALLGVMVLLWPAITIVVAAIFFGAYLLVTGISQVIFAFSLHVSAGGRVLLFLSGAAALILAVLCFRSLQESVLLLAIWIGIGFIFRGVATAVSAISDPTLPGRAWEIFIGVISLIAGVVILASPFESLATLTLVVGIWLIVLGIFEVVSAFGIRKESKKLPEARQEVTAPAPE